MLREIYIGYCQQTTLGVLLRAIYSHIIVIIQLLLRGDSTQDIHLYVYTYKYEHPGFHTHMMILSTGY